MADVKQPAGVALSQPYTPTVERELTDSYRAHYDSLLTQAREALGPELAHFSGKMAQQAMLATFARRTEFATPQSFDGALHEAVLDEAATQRRKHAALHQREGTSPRAPHVAPLSADEAVAQLLATLHTAPVDHATAVNAAMAARKQHAAEHVQHVGRGRSWKGPAIMVAVLGVVIVGGMRWVNAAGTESVIRKAIDADDARKVAAARGQRGNVELGDSSKVRIGSDSRLRMPATFGTTVRTLQVEGTASFTVAPGQTLPFTVWAGNAIITATGTRFTVRAFPDDSAVVVGVEEGSVSVRARDDGASESVAAGKAVRLTPDGKIAALEDASAATVLSWTRDSLVFVDAPASVVLPELIRWFDLKAALADPALGSRPVTLRVGLESSGDALKAFAAAASLSIGFDKDDKVVLSDAAPSAATNPTKGAKP